MTRLKKLYTILSIITPLGLAAQINTPDPYPTTTKVNYVSAWEATAPEPSSAVLVNRPLRDVKQTTSFLDGLARPLQTVTKKGSWETGNPTPSDFVNPSIYNNLGQEKYKFLAFVSGTDDGGFKLNAFQQQSGFMQTQFGPQGETWFYNQTNYEASPLNRVEKVMSAGDNWVGGPNGGRGVEVKYWINTSADDVKKWTVNDVVNSWGTYEIAGVYGTGDLTKAVSIDEHGKKVIEFKDKEGNVILKKVQLGPAAIDNGDGIGYTDWICTYYLYDKMGRLRLVIQPRGVELLIQNNWNINALNGDILNEQCFRYEFDTRNSMIRKKIPGAGEIYMVYDKRGRLVMTQDAKLRTGSPSKWLVTLYDYLNRPVETGLWDNTNDVIYHNDQAIISTSVDYPFSTATVPGSGYEYLSRIGYDSYSTIPAVSGLSSTFDNSFNSYLYSDYGTTPLFAEQLIVSNYVNGLVTWTQIKVLGTSTYLYTVNIYDTKGRVIQMKGKNFTGGVDINTFQYNFSNQHLVVVNKNEKTSPNPQTHIIVTKSEYDDLGRLSNIKKTISSTINGQAVYKPETEIARYEYNSLGQVKSKKLSPNFNSGQGLETLDQEYNIRGWLLGVNRSFLETPDKTHRWFGFDIAYDKWQAHAYYGYYWNQQFNGNITGMIWKSKGDKIARKYDFVYDAANRLLKADYNQQNNGGVAWEHNDVDFSLRMGDGADPYSAYDVNGNIKKMVQWGVRFGGVLTFDDLTYTYKNNNASNRLLAVSESAAIGTSDYNLGDFTDKNQALDDYDYDVNGNLLYDKNKSIGSINYNFLNLPSSVNVTAKGTITYVYDASGSTHKKITDETNATVYYNGSNYVSNITTTTTYCGNAVYESKSYTNANLTSLAYTDKLLFISHEEGKIRFEPATNATCPAQPDRFIYDYFIKDHLGNVRMVLTEQREDVCYIPATVEDSRYLTEKEIYNIVDARRISKTTAGASSIASFEQKVYRVNGGLANEKTGLGVVIKVMGGDQVKIVGESFYTMPGGGPGSALPYALDELLSSFVGSSAITSSKHGGITTGTLAGVGVNTNSLNNFINNNNAGTNTAEAFINWILFDDQLRFVAGDVDAVQPGGGYKFHNKFINTPVNVSKNGYLFIFVSNESNLPVYFDNLNVTHIPGPLVEETHYHPFGLTMSGISSRSFAFRNENKFKFNGIQQNSDLNINIYDALYRNLDPQIGRWWQIDVKPKDHESPYNAMGNCPIAFNDFLGDTTVFFDMDNNYLGTIWDDAHPRRVKVLAEAYNETVAGLTEDDLKDKRMANRLASRLIANLRAFEDANKQSNVIAFETRIRLSFTGETFSDAATRIDPENIRGFLAKNEYAVGTLHVYSTFDDNTELESYSYSANTGPWGYGPIPNGNYEAYDLWPWGEGGFNRNNVGYRILLTDNVTHHRTELRVHPEGGAFGTQGCIGLTVGRNDLLMFRNVILGYFRSHPGERIAVNVNLTGNPNYTNDGSMERNRANYLEQQRRQGRRPANNRVRE